MTNAFHCIAPEYPSDRIDIYDMLFMYLSDQIG